MAETDYSVLAELRERLDENAKWRSGQDITVTKLGQSVDNLTRDVQELTVAVRSQSEAFSKLQRTNWPVLLALATLSVSLVGGSFFIINLQTDNTIEHVVAPLVTQFSYSKAEQETYDRQLQQISAEVSDSQHADQNSRDDRAQLNARLQKAETIQADVKAQIADLQAHIVEIETQFRASGNAFNMNAAQDRRLFALLWEKTYGTRFPSDIQFYPQFERAR